MRIVSFLAIFFACTVCGAADQILPSVSQLQPANGVDLGIADDETFRRPNSWSELKTDQKIKHASVEEEVPTEIILAGDLSGPASRPGMSIAWRNAAQIEEVEVRIRNLGNKAGYGRVSVDVTDDVGIVLLHLEPPPELLTIRVPAFSDGGREGKIIRMKASRALNNLIDRFDLERKRYNVRARVETVGAKDLNPQDNIKTKSWNIPFRVEPGMTNVFNYRFRNNESSPISVQWRFERTPYPKDWKIEGVPDNANPFILEPGELIQGTLTMKAPVGIEEGAFVEARLGLLESETGEVFQQHEWFQVYDTVPPNVTDYRLVVTEDGRIAIQVLVADQGSGVLEATGVSTQFSTDDGRTFAVRAHNYKAGNFVIPTLFEGVIGPFPKGTKLQLRFLAKDTAGNMTSVIPDDAVAVKAPRGSEKLLDLAYIFPRTQPNALFMLEPGDINLGEIASDVAVAITEGNRDTAQVEGVAKALRELPITKEGKDALLEAVDRLSKSAPSVLTSSKFSEVVSALSVTTDAVATVSPVSLESINSPGSDLLEMTTIGVEVE